ncbi:MAG TPA: bifunctional riboflavin kinase/FAD synthetase [Burkholderiaceae bacterium]|nr:bifunctional riboflavin kinase/FAD synthetase [Burkholderiaceae bacterium]
MQLVRGRTAITATLGRDLRRAAIVIGNFDGVHRGHQALIETARRLADNTGGEVVALTFDPHPARLLAPGLAPPLIVPLARRAELLGQAGVDVVVVEPFTRAFAAIEAEDFGGQVLARDLRAAHVVVGYDFSFGKGRRGDTAMLGDLGERHGFGVSIVRRVSIHGLTCSSTKVREFVLEGRVEGAAVLLGRPFEITGPVARGAGRGRGIGYPTANVRSETELLPKPGIYAARAQILDGGGAVVGSHVAALSVGTNPTFVADGGLTIEVYLLEFEGDLYDQRLRLQLVERLRDELRFDSVDALKAQIAADVARTRELVR